MHEQTIKVYGYNELDDHVRMRLLEGYQRAAHEMFPAEMLTDWFKDFLSDKGFDLEDIRWSFSCCQGDGVAFYGLVDLETLEPQQEAVKAVLDKARALAAARPGDTEYEGEDRYCFILRIEKCNSHYDHWNSMSVQVEVDNYDDDTEILDPYISSSGEVIHWSGEGTPPEKYGLGDIARDLEETVQELCRELSREMEKAGYDDIEYQTSEEVCLEQLQDMGEVFAENGDYIG